MLARARAAFVSGGYAGTSVDDLLRATGLFRASLYQAFGSKRGLFLAVLQRGTAGTAGLRAASSAGAGASVASPDLDLLLVALMDLAPVDAEVRRLAARAVSDLGEDAASTLGRRLIERAERAAPTHPDEGGRE